MQLEDWKEEAPENRAYFERSERLFLLVGGVQQEPPDTGKAWEKVRSKLDANKVKPLYARPSLWRAAAGLLLLLGTGIAALLLFRANKEERPLAYSAGNSPQNLVLPDGSQATLYAQTSLTAPEGFGKKHRVMKLRGNATFSVVHNDAMPFVIDADRVFIKDIGTRFAIRTSPDTDTVYVHVEEGVVLLFDSLGAELEIRAGEHALYIRSRKQITQPTAAANPPSLILDFRNRSLEDVVATLNATFHTRIVLEHASLKQCTITTRFEQENLETILGIITETLGLSYEQTSDGYLIKGRSCHS